MDLVRDLGVNEKIHPVGVGLLCNPQCVPRCIFLCFSSFFVASFFIVSFFVVSFFIASFFVAFCGVVSPWWTD